ncbi:hypothetical protein PtA15_13A363 [Puccinia triticina]|uniref:(2E,6E)-farnesyl diphosphate synthase n=1 Tax=Puccinia triticina TaxID=208348 RepID=A0ABY7D1E3_9BASI|nr:uncharacterized protein PtA15_13A363 [Puccinia triticina]WAQ90963.1 hypothetical protein PtA15_13A363 [Puccinia triticina]
MASRLLRLAQVQSRCMGPQSPRLVALCARSTAPQDTLLIHRRHSAAALRKSIFDPFHLLAAELRQVKENVQALVDSADPDLASIAKYYFASARQGKHLRPLLILLISQATASPPPSDYQPPQFNQPISRPDILDDDNPTHPTSSEPVDQHTLILPAQRRLAEITELLHVASLLHDDVIDEAETRRGQPSAPLKFGKKKAVLAGDFLLGRASIAAARLRNYEVNALVASTHTDIIQGELVQLAAVLNHPSESLSPSPPPSSALKSNSFPTASRFDHRLFDFYQRRNYLKAAAYIAKFCQAAVILSPSASQEPALVKASFEFGKHLGLAFQVVDDALNCTSSAESFGKAGDFSDLKTGVITAPGLFAWKKFDSEFGELFDRKFSCDGDLDLAKKMIEESDAINQSYQLASHHIDISRSQLSHFKDSPAKQGLNEICNIVLTRSY